VAACDAIWQDDWTRALDLIRQVLDALRGGRAPQRYAALWNYLAFTIAHRLATKNNDTTLHTAASAFYEAARAAARGTTWLSHLAAAPAEGASTPQPPVIDARVENELYQTRLRAAQDPLNFPIKLNDKIAALQGVIESVDNRPTDQTAQVFDLLNGQLTT
jgi:hypothetical protein